MNFFIEIHRFDDLTDKYRLEKVKTIGDAYFCAGGLHSDGGQSDSPERMLRVSVIESFEESLTFIVAI